MNYPWSVFIIKPDAVERRKIAEILLRLEGCDFKITAMKLVMPDVFQLHEHYKEHRGKDFFPALIESMCDKWIVVGQTTYLPAPEQSVPKLRAVTGCINPPPPGTIRGDFAIDFRRNSFHASDSSEAAYREFHIWFPELT